MRSRAKWTAEKYLRFGQSPVFVFGQPSLIDGGGSPWRARFTSPHRSCGGIARGGRCDRRDVGGAAPVISTGTHRMHAPGRPCSLVHHRPVNYDGDQATSRATPPIFDLSDTELITPTTQARGAVADASSIKCWW